MMMAKIFDKGLSSTKCNRSITIERTSSTRDTTSGREATTSGSRGTASGSRTTTSGAEDITSGTEESMSLVQDTTKGATQNIDLLEKVSTVKINASEGNDNLAITQ